MTPSTCNSFAIIGTVLLVPLYCIVDVREITRSVPIDTRSLISCSVIPSAKYS